MMHSREEKALGRWFEAWIQKDASAIGEVFAKEIVYSECYGPVYRGLEQIRRWFGDWNQKGRVLEWTIRETYRDGDCLIAVWFFLCEFEGNTDGFDGVTISRFDAEGKIISLREFQSKAEHTLVYGEA